MAVFILKRAAQAVPVLLGVTILVFAILQLIPGNPAQILLLGTGATPAQVAQLDRQLGLDQPVVLQYFHYLGRLLTGNLGYSYVTQQTVTSEIASRLPFTLSLTGAALLVALLVGIPLGIIAGLRSGGLVDTLATGVSVLGVAVPYFWLAILLILVFAVKLGILPVLGTGSPAALVLPAVSLGWGYSGIITRLLRNGLIEAYQRPFILVTRAKGLSGWQLLWKHGLRNAIASTVSVVGLQIGYLLAGSVAIETIFGRPGLGSFLVQSIQEKDIPSVQGIVLVVALVYVGVNLVVDVLHALIDPRIRRAVSV